MRLRHLCEELGVSCAVEERGDWLMQGLHLDPDDTTHLILVLSQATDGCWWVPFQAGRAAERGTSVIPFLTDPAADPPGFLAGVEPARDLDALRRRLPP